MLKFISNIFLFLFVSLSFLFIGCEESSKPARGPEDELYVVADSLEFEELKPALETAFEKIIYTPQPEKMFTLKRVSPNQIEKVKGKKNVIITAPLNSNSVTSQFIHAIIDSSVKSQIMNEGDFVITRHGLWSRNQLVMLLTAPTIQELEYNIVKDADNLIYSFQKVSDRRLYESLYNSKYEQKDVEGKFLRDYGWIIYVQADYKVAMDKPEDNFVWLRRGVNTDMERWIFVHWIEDASSEYLSEDSVRAIRNRITEKHYTTPGDAHVIIAEDYFMISEVNFNGRYALFTQGLWDLNIKGMGGPFINYTFFCENTGRLYMIDGSIFAPKYYKRNLIQQMDVTLQSFMTEDEIDENKKQELLKAVR
jgi:hypothetical protein